MKAILEKHLTDEIHTYFKLRKGFENSSGKLEESGKILGKTCGLGPTEENTPLKRIIEEVDDAPVRFGEREMKAENE